VTGRVSVGEGQARSRPAAAHGHRIGAATSPTTLEPDDPRHGTLNGYTNLGCRCEKCRAARAEYMRLYWRSRPGIRSKQLKAKYAAARAAGFSSAEARRRQFWSDPLADTRWPT
jgi:hypothetical protein